MAYTNTGNQFIDALAAYRWANNQNQFRIFFDNSGSGGAWTFGEQTLFVVAALEWEHVANVSFSETFDEAQADFVERKETDATWPTKNPTPFGDHNYPGAPSVGRYNTSKFGWNTTSLQV